MLLVALVVTSMVADRKDLALVALFGGRDTPSPAHCRLPLPVVAAGRASRAVCRSRHPVLLPLPVAVAGRAGRAVCRSRRPELLALPSAVASRVAQNRACCLVSWSRYRASVVNHAQYFYCKSARWAVSHMYTQLHPPIGPPPKMQCNIYLFKFK
jgi:hypothetical protein